MKIAIGSTLQPKVEAVKEAWEVFSSKILIDQDEEIFFSSYDVSNGHSAMPLNLSELMEGTQDRVENLMLQLKKEKTEADFYVGLEGGFNVINDRGPRRQVFLESWAYVCDGYRGFFGNGGGLHIPSSIAGPVIDRGLDLEIVMDRLGDPHQRVSSRGTWEVLTQDLLNRKRSFVLALIAVFAPFYHPQAYN